MSIQNAPPIERFLWSFSPFRWTDHFSPFPEKHRFEPCPGGYGVDRRKRIRIRVGFAPFPPRNCIGREVQPFRHLGLGQTQALANFPQGRWRELVLEIAGYYGHMRLYYSTDLYATKGMSNLRPLDFQRCSAIGIILSTKVARSDPLTGTPADFNTLNACAEFEPSSTWGTTDRCQGGSRVLSSHREQTYGEFRALLFDRPRLQAHSQIPTKMITRAQNCGTQLSSALWLPHLEHQSGRT